MRFSTLPLFIFVLASTLSAQVWAYKAHRVIGTSDGLLFNAIVKHINFDQLGYPWFASEYGLFRDSQIHTRRVDRQQSRDRLYSVGGDIFRRVFPLTSSTLLVAINEQPLLFRVDRDEFVPLGEALLPEFGKGVLAGGGSLPEGRFALITEDGHCWQLELMTQSLNSGFSLPVVNAYEPWLDVEPGQGALASQHHLQLVSAEGEQETRLWPSFWFWGGVAAVMLLGLLGWMRQQQLNRARLLSARLQASEEKLLQALDGNDSELWEWHADVDKAFVSNHSGLLGSQKQLIKIRPESLRLHPDDQQEFLQLCHRLRSGELSKFESEFKFLQSNGTVGWMRIRGKSLLDDAGKLQRIVGIYSDISAMRNLKSKAKLLASVFEHTVEGVLILDGKRDITVANRSAISLLGEGLEGRSFSSLLTISNLDDELFREVNGQHGWSGELELAVPDGSCPVWLNASAMSDGSKNTVHYVVVFSDIRERKRSEADLRRLANYDMLTGLPNRTLFGTRLMKAMLQAGQTDEKLALLFLDLDRFKQVNDSYGHGMGDALLIEAASRLQICMGPEHTLCRFGGDEFVVLARDVGNLDGINRLAETMLQQMNLPFELYGREFYLSASIGISIWPDDTSKPEALIKYADQAMYHAKEEDGGNFQYFSPERNAEALYHLRLEADLRRALEDADFELYFQPQISIRDGQEQLVGIEALLRWQHPSEGFIRPDIFVAVAECCGLVKQLDLWVLREACRQGQMWCELQANPICVAVNISAAHFRSPDFVDGVKRILKETRMLPENLELEITEGVLMKEVALAQEHLRKLSEIGVKVAIDDFGTGYSSLAYLRHFEVNSLKIDRTFFIDIVHNVSDQAIVSSIVELARNLKLDVVAEGVETQEQLQQAYARGCYTIQGYYFSKPMPATEMDAYLKSLSVPLPSD